MAALSSLSTANKQPQLALELILQTVSGSQVVGAAQSPPPASTVAAPTAVAGTPDSVIDLYA